MFDIITIGDTTTDIFLFIDENNPFCSLNKSKTELKFKYASKVPVKELQRVIGGGNAANHAFGAAKLGLKTAIYTIVGEDDAGDAVINKLKKAKINAKYVRFDKHNGTNMAVIIKYAVDRTIMSYHSDRDYHLPNFDRTKWIYFSSICNNHAEFNNHLLDYIKRKKIKLAFNPGSKQMELGMSGLKPVIETSDVLFVNKQEAERLLGGKKEIKKLLQGLRDAGAKIVVITDGANGSYCYDGSEAYHLGIMNLPVVESTGSGDAYASGFMSAIINGKKITEAMQWGGVNAAGVAGYVGSQAGLLDKKGLLKILSEHKYFKVKTI